MNKIAAVVFFQSAYFMGQEQKNSKNLIALTSHFSAVNNPLADLSTFELLPVAHTIFGLMRANWNSLGLPPATSISSPFSSATKKDFLGTDGGIQESKTGPFFVGVSLIPSPVVPKVQVSMLSPDTFSSSLSRWV